MHKRETVSNDFIQQFMCDVPTYNPKNKDDADRPSYPERIGIDTHRTFREEGLGVNPGPGSYLMYHRLDGRLIGVGLIDICPSQVLNSAYFQWDPDFKFLNLGTLGALMEIQYMRLLR